MDAVVYCLVYGIYRSIHLWVLFKIAAALTYYPLKGVHKSDSRPSDHCSAQVLLLSDRTPPSHLSLLFAEVFRKLSLNFSTGKFGHGLCTLDGADTICPCTGEDNIHLFQTSALWLGEKEVDGGDQGSVQNCKDDVCPPCSVKSVIDLIVEISIPLTLQVGEGWRRDHDDDEVTQPVGDSRDGVRVDTSTQVRELSWQQPSHSKPPGIEV